MNDIDRNDSRERSRMLLELGQKIREINRTVINPEFPELQVDDLAPTTLLVAKARAQYLRELADIAAKSDGDQPKADDIGRLRQLRETYQELLQASQALETAIERGYLDVRG